MRKRILFTIEDITVFGGVQRVLKNLTQLLIHSGFDITVLSWARHPNSPAFPFDKEVKIKYLDNSGDVSSSSVNLTGGGAISE